VNIGVACGGTGGHIFPGLATAEVLRQRGHDVTLWLAGKNVESAAASGWKGPVVTVVAEGFETGASWRALSTLWTLWRAIGTCTEVMRASPPAVMLAMGSYASVGPIRAAVRCGVPYVLHESNVIPGRAMRWLARRAAAVAGAFEETGYYLKRADLVMTGMPLRRDLELAAAQTSARPADFTLLVMGGSGGARRLNEVVPAALAALHREGRAPRIIHLTGRVAEGSVRAAYEQAGVPATVYGFTHDMAGLYRQASFALCRSGAATCAELSAFGIPALLVPYPHAISDHQTANARALEKVGAADVVADGDLTSAWLATYLRERMNQPERLAEMGRQARSRLQASGAERLADLLEQIGGRSRGRSAPR
jgi:UDP-N-acetylglucosamine--N-acetylmuramyl-(pentapeptide) pyrophosphoryl-undecaprenol N-acetylglucosamine transferase